MRFLLFIMLVLNLSLAHAQFTIEGRVTDEETNDPIPYASIGISGTNKGTSSNAIGFFSLIVPDSTVELKVMSIGYQTLVINKIEKQLIVRMKPSTIQLREVIISDKNLNAKKIVRKAFRRISTNYNRKPFLQKYFYRHYCRDDSTYGRLIEAAVEVYKRKGYRMQQPRVGYKEEIRVTQLRRSFDSTNLRNRHVPIAIHSPLISDIVGYQQKSSDSLFKVIFDETSLLKIHLSKTKFTLESITTYDGEEVYKINFFLNVANEKFPKLSLKNTLTGTLYINTKDHAFLRVDQLKLLFNKDTVKQVAYYKKQEGKYYPYHLLYESKGKGIINKDSGTYFLHNAHIELVCTEVMQRNFKKFKGKEPGKEALLDIPFDSSFWKTYTILKATPLEENIIRHLGGNKSLNQQYAEYTQIEKEKIENRSKQEYAYNQLMERHRGKEVIYLDFWASWCPPCVKEMKHQLKLVEKFKNSVCFVLLSVDSDEEKWKSAREKYGLNVQGVFHFRIGNESDAENFYEVVSIPRYILFDKAGNHYMLDAPRPSDPKIVDVLNLLTR